MCGITPKDSRGNKRCMSQHMHITIVVLVHRRPLAELVQIANFTVKRVYFSLLSWEKQITPLVDGKRMNRAGTSISPCMQNP